MGGPVAVGAQAEKGLGCGGMCGQEKRSTLTLTNRRLEMMTLWTPLWRWRLLALLKWLYHSKEFQRYLSMNSVIRRMQMLTNENTKNKYKITKNKKKTTKIYEVVRGGGVQRPTGDGWDPTPKNE